MKSIFKLWNFFRHYRKSLIVMFICGIFMSLCQGTIVPISAYLFDKIFSHSMGAGAELGYINQIYTSLFGDDRKVLLWAIPLSIVALYFLNGFFRYWHLFLMRYIGDQVANDLRKTLQRSYLRLSQSFHHDYSSGSGGLLSRTLSDVQTVQNSTGQLAEFVREPVLAIYLLGYMFYMDWKLTCFLLLAAPVLALSLKQLARSLRKYGHLHQETMENITSTLKESLDGIKIIQSYNLEKKMENLFESRTHQFLHNRKKIIGREEIAGPVSEVIGSFVFAGMAIYFGNDVVNHGGSSGGFVGFILAMGFMQKPIKKIQNAFILIQQSIVSINRIMEIIEDPRQVSSPERPQSFPLDWKKVRFVDVHFSYGDGYAVKNINLTVQRGEIVAIVGASGSGKSTLINLLERFFDTSSGDIFIDDINIKDIDLKELRKNIALVTQDVFLFNDSVRTNISYGDLDKDPSQIERSAIAANAHPFISQLPEAYESPVGERGAFFSGGEKQRISIARAIFKDAPILILDEATSALDSISEIEVQNGLNKLMEGRTAFVIAHRLSTIKAADRILVMASGQIVEEGTHQELLDLKREYFQYFKHQTENL